MLFIALASPSMDLTNERATLRIGIGKRPLLETDRHRYDNREIRCVGRHAHLELDVEQAAPGEQRGEADLQHSDRGVATRDCGAIELSAAVAAELESAAQRGPRTGREHRAHLQVDGISRIDLLAVVAALEHCGVRDRPKKY